MSTNLKDIRAIVSNLKLDDSLLYLNHVLATIRGETSDIPLSRAIENSKAVPPHIIHFLAKEVITNSSNLGPRVLDWNSFDELRRLTIELDDPIQHDSDWKHADPTGFLVRMFNQQFPAQEQRMAQKFGLALGLYRDVGGIEYHEQFNLREEIEAEIGVSIESFMSLGFVATALRTAKHGVFRCSGTFRPADFSEAYSQGIEVCIPENWSPFLERTSCSVTKFREIVREHSVGDDTSTYTQFEFNPLRRFPILDIGDQRYLAPDPRLIVERVTHGLFYDLFERDRTRFSERFGDAFDAFVGQLLRSAITANSLWSEAAVKRAKGRDWQAPSKNADQAYIGLSQSILIECKSMRPSVELATYGRTRTVRLHRRRAWMLR